MASIQPGTATLKPTFAKVAASGYVPPNTTKPSPPNTKQEQLAGTPTLENSPFVVKASQPMQQILAVTPSDLVGSSDNQPTRNVQKILKSQEPEMVLKREQTDKQEAQGSSDSAQNTASTDDGATQVSSSNSSAKQPNLDNKSMASVTTFALDEKESIRPEDSASLKATEEEDRLSAQGSGTAGSRFGSDSGARAFRDQLREISNMAAPIPRVVPGDRFTPALIMNPSVAYEDGTIQPTVQPQSLPSQNLPGMMVQQTVPDERLVEALSSGRDRVWVLKLEQDIIDFVKDSKETQLILPQCNSFYRMLAHKLADYYLLDHTVDTSNGGSAVVIKKTAFCQTFPPPLSGLPNPSSVASTPPPMVQARKIMRRGYEGNQASFPSTTANSEGPSKTTSEAGGESTSENGIGMPNEPQNKANMTREEREAKYKEARLRIFGKVEETESNEAENKTDDNDNSRASSTTGKKKARKQRQDSDDFEPRSQFQIPTFYAPQYPTNGSYENGGTVYYPLYPGLAPNNQSGPQPLSYPDPYVQMMPPEQQAQYQYPGSLCTVYGQSAGMDYDLSSQFNRGMQSFQNASPSPRMPANSPMASASNNTAYPHYQVQPAFNQQWQPMAYSQAYPQPPYMGPQYADRPMSSPGQMPTNGHFAFPQPALATFHNGQQQRVQSPMQPGFARQQFNPQSQAFIPGNCIPPPPQAPMQMMQMAGSSPRLMTMMPPPPPPPPPPPMTNVGRQSSSSYNSPRPHPHSMPVSLPPTTTVSNITSSNTGNMTVASTNQPLSHPLPTPPNPNSSIAKWGVPAHLPAKPPPPMSMEPHKYNELTRGYQGLPGLPTVGPNGLLSGAGMNGPMAAPGGPGSGPASQMNGNTGVNGRVGGVGGK